MKNIKLKGARNTRDFGFTENSEGKKIKPHCFIRSAALNKINDKDADALKNEYKLGTVIDLRTQTERDEKPDVKIDGVAYYHIPVFSEKAAGITHEKEVDKRELLSKLPEMTELYRTMVSDEQSVAQLKRIFEIITASQDSAVLWHCTEGKDRCGLVSALLLLILDVSVETVFEDYLYTNVSAEKRARKYYRLVYLLSRDKASAEKVQGMFLAKREYLEAAFDEINTLYGSTAAFIKNNLGITDEKKAELKAKYLE